MKKRNEEWSKPQQAEGARMAQAWEEFFVAAEKTPEARPRPPVELEQQARLAAVRATHEEELLRYPNVVGVAEGIRTRGGRPTGEPCLVVLVQRKVPRKDLAEDEVLPAEIEGVPVDVVAIGLPRPLPS